MPWRSSIRSRLPIDILGEPSIEATPRMSRWGSPTTEAELDDTEPSGGAAPEHRLCRRIATPSASPMATGKHLVEHCTPHSPSAPALLADTTTVVRRIDLRWHDLRHEGACRLLADGVDIRIIQLMLGHASIQQTQRYLNVTDEELRKGLEVSWGRQLRAVSGQWKRHRLTDCPRFVPGSWNCEKWLLGLDSNQQPSG